MKVLTLVGFPGFKVICVQLFLVVFREVPVHSDNPLQQPCPLTISLVSKFDVERGLCPVSALKTVCRAF